MTTLTLDTIIDAIETTLSAAASLKTSYTYDKITEGIADPPSLQVWPFSGTTSDGGENDRATFRGGRRIGHYVIYADLYARQRSHLGEDMKALVTAITDIETILEAQNVAPFFGLAADSIKSFRWRWEHVTFSAEGNNYQYIGARFTIDVWVF